MFTDHGRLDDKSHLEVSIDRDERVSGRTCERGASAQRSRDQSELVAVQKTQTNRSRLNPMVAGAPCEML